MACSTESTCDICKTSINPARLGPDLLCACPIGYYEKLKDPQCYSKNWTKNEKKQLFF